MKSVDIIGCLSRVLSCMGRCEMKSWLPVFDTLRTEYYDDILIVFNHLPSTLGLKTQAVRYAD